MPKSFSSGRAKSPSPETFHMKEELLEKSSANTKPTEAATSGWRSQQETKSSQSLRGSGIRSSGISGMSAGAQAVGVEQAVEASEKDRFRGEDGWKLQS